MDDCFNSIKKAFENDKNFTDEDIRKIVDDFTKIRDKFGVSGLIEQAGKYEELLSAKAASEAKRFAKSAAVYKGLKMDMTSAKDYSYGLRSILGGGNEVFNEARSSVGLNQQRIKNAWQEKITTKLNDLGIDKVYLHSPEFSKDVRVELFDIIAGKENVSKTGNPVAFELATTMRQIFTHMREEYTRLGVDIGNIENYMGWQRYNREKVAAQGKAAFAADVLNHSVHEKTFPGLVTDTEKLARAGEMYDHIMGGDAIDPTKGRSIHFGSGESVNEMMSKYGMSESAVSGMFEQISYTAKIQGLMSKLGPDYKYNYEKLLSLAKKQSGTAEYRAQQMWATATGVGRFSTDPHATVARVGTVARAVQSASKLGGAMLSALGPDMAMTGARIEANTPGGGILTSFGNVLSTYAKQGFSKEAQQAYFKAAGMVADDILNAYHLDVADNGVGERAVGAAAKAAAFTYKYSGLAWHDKAMTTAAIRMQGSRLFSVADTAFNDLDPKITHNFKRYGIGQKEWDIIRKATHEYGDTKTLMPSAIMDLEDSAVGGTAIKHATYAKYANYINDIAAASTLKPDLVTRSALNVGLADDHYVSQLFQTIGQFKSASVQGIRTMKYIANADPRYAKARFGDVGAMASAGVLLTAMGYLADSAKELVKGNTPPDPTRTETWVKATARGGALGPIMDYMSRDYSSDRQQFVVDLAGPVFSTINEGAQVLSEAVRGKKNAGQDALRLLQSNIPGNNIFYAKMAYNYLLGDRLLDHAKPGATIRQANALRAKGQRKVFSGLGADNQNTILGGGN